MLKDIACEVIGCTKRASWLRVVRQEACCEEFLCHVHWELLRERHLEQASYYIHLSSLFAEGTGLTSFGAIAHPRQVCDVETNRIRASKSSSDPEEIECHGTDNDQNGS
jgi:hypothetical protein